MRRLLALALAVSGCTAMEEADVGPWRPAPRADAPDPSAAVAEAPASAWREVDPENLLLVELAGGARVAIELAPGFAPVHVANIRRFARAGWWRDATVYRLQENYVAQWGVGESERPLPEGVVELPPAEYTRPLAGLDVRPLGNPDPYAPAAGFAEGWPVGYDPGGLRAWLAHCYGAVGVARGLAPDTGTGSELYAVIGHAPRHLDRNIALVGRVIGGIEALTSLPRGTGRLGFYEQEARRLPIERVVLAADLPPDERPSYEAMRTESDAFGDYLIGRANRGGEFFTVPAGGVDLCNVGVPVRVAR